MKLSNYIFIIFLLLSFNGLFASSITFKEAERTARNFYFEKSGIRQSDIIFENTFIKKTENNNDYFIFDVEGEKGFVIVSAEDGYTPIIGYSIKGSFKLDNQPENLKYWMGHYSYNIQYIRENNYVPTKETNNKWKKYNVIPSKFIKLLSTKSVDPLVGDILWNQGAGWNTACPVDDNGPDGHVYVGCVATAMGIIMKYWEYPIHGTGSHSYYHYPYGTIAANFSSVPYFWSLMDDTDANDYSAELLFHLGVSVEMRYGYEGSGAYSTSVPNAVANYFGYNNAVHKSKQNYTNANWINLLKSDIDNGYPLYYSGHDDEGGHAFVCSGYDDANNFHFNFGWSGSGNGFYALDDVGGFHYSQAVVKSFYPTGNYVYPNKPTNVNAELDLTNTDNFNVHISWDQPQTKSVDNYIIYRDFDQLATLSSSTFSYIDLLASNESHDYSVRAVHSDGESLVSYSKLDGEFDITFNFSDTNGNPINKVSTNLSNSDGSYMNDIYSSFLSFVKYPDILWGGGYSITANHDDFSSINFDIDFVNQDMTYDIVMEEGGSLVESNKNYNLKIYPNPASDVLNVIIENNINSTIILSDITGKIVFTLNTNENNNLLKIKHLQKGVYILKYSNTLETISKKILIN